MVILSPNNITFSPRWKKSRAVVDEMPCKSCCDGREISARRTAGIGSRMKPRHSRKICRHWITGGSDPVHGCRYGESCRFFHPRLCRNSVRHRVCFNKRCRYAHMKGTKRRRRQRLVGCDEVFSSSQPGYLPNSTAPQPRFQSVRPAPLTEIDRAAVRGLMRDEMEHVTAKLEAVIAEVLCRFKGFLVGELDPVKDQLDELRQLMKAPSRLPTYRESLAGRRRASKI